MPVVGHQRRDRSRAFPGPVLRVVARNRPSCAPGRHKLDDVCGSPGRLSLLNEGDDRDDSAKCLRAIGVPVAVGNRGQNGTTPEVGRLA